MNDVCRPRTLEDALALRAEHPDAVPVAGGTDLMVAVNSGRARPHALLDLSRVEELRSWWREPARVFVGAGVTFARIAADLPEVEALAAAARSVGSAQIRNRATLGGNLGTASPAGDALCALAAYDAEIVVASAYRTRRLPWHAFLLGPKRNALEPDELILGAEWTRAHGPGSFAKVGPRRAMAIAVASVCVQRDDGVVRIALGAVAPTVVRATHAEAAALAGLPAAEVAARAAGECEPIDDVRGTAVYRRHAIEVLVRRAIAETEAGRRAA